MKKIISAILCLLMLVSLAACGDEVDADSYDPSSSAEAWIEKQIKNNTLFSFDYDGKAYRDHINSWEKTVEETENGWVVSYKKDSVIAWSEISFDEEMAAIEWTNYFKNESSSDSPVISNILAMNTQVSVANPVLTTANGSTCAPTDFEPIWFDLANKGSYAMATSGGRSSQGAWPYFDISNGEYGIMGAIGWTGDWKADFTHKDGKIDISAGMQKTNISLYAGEQMRTPMILLQFFKGNQDDGHNALRQLLLKSYVPKEENGDPVRIPQLISMDGMDSEEATIAALETRREQGRDYEGLWIDASWYGDLGLGTKIADGEWDTQVGNWYFNAERFPNNNMLKVGTWLEEQGLDFVLWVEPERVKPETQLAQEHPEWMLKDDDNGFYLYDLSNDEACDYLIEKIGGIIQGSKITWYRQDFNCNPSRKWEAADTDKNRVGMTEIKYITNLYRYWDTLVDNNPGLMIDNCSSGGRRLDLEMVKRSVTLWRTDFQSQKSATADAVRSINYDLSWWIPLHGGGYPQASTANPLYNLRSHLGAGGPTGYNMDREAYTLQALAENKICREMMYGDYYMLSYGVGDEVYTKNAAYQYNVPEDGKGYVITFRPEQSETESSTFALKGLDAQATYTLEIADTGETFTASGQELMTKGIHFRYPQQGFSILVYYSKV